MNLRRASNAVSATRRAIDRRLFDALVLGLFSVAACAPDAPTGVQVSVRLEPGTSVGAFDHITVIAEGGGKRGVACFYAPGQNLAPSAGKGSAADPCADNPLLATGDLPTADVWKLSETPRVANFDFAEGEGVTLTALAKFGNKEIARANAKANGASPFAQQTLVLSATDGAACTIPLQGRGPATARPASKCDSLGITTDCIDPQGTAPKRTSAVTCFADTGGVVHNTDDTCGKMPVVLSTLIPRVADISECVSGFFEVEFARCADNTSDLATCPKTSDCEVPSTAIDILPAGLGTGSPVHLALDCLPATTYTLVVGPVALPRSFTFQISQAKATERACSLVLKGSSYLTAKKSLNCQ